MAPVSPATDRRLVEIPPDQVAHIRALVARVGPRLAALDLGIGRTAIFGVLARGRAMPGTAALLREAMRGRQ